MSNIEQRKASTGAAVVATVIVYTAAYVGAYCAVALVSYAAKRMVSR